MHARMLLAALLSMSFLGLVACEEEGPAERAGEQIDEAVSEAQERLEEAEEEAEEAVEEIREAVQGND